jgi:hypothetical protein
MECKGRSTAYCRCVRAAAMAVTIVFVISVPSLAQDFGSIVGTVTDPSQAVIPGAKITVTNELTGVVVRTTATNDAGNYAVPSLPPSVYSVTAEAAGFATVVRSHVTLQAKDVLRADLTLELRSVAQEVTVTAPVVAINTETGERSEGVSANEILPLSINGRSVIQIATLIPGAASQLPSFNVPVGPTSSTSINFNGERQAHNVWSIDGIEDYDRGCGGCIVVVPSQEAIQEFKVETSSATETTGFATGGQIRMVTKSGTSKFHGSLFEINRNTAMAASSFFANASGTSQTCADLQ